MKTANLTSTEQVLHGLINRSEDLDALNGGAYGTTRLSNIISKLRALGLDIETITKWTPKGKKYGLYRLEQNFIAREKARDILEDLRKKRLNK